MRQILDRALALPRGRRHLIALAGPPASGKTTLAARLSTALGEAGRPAAVVPMDGFHLDNILLEGKGLLSRKGAPETFDARGFLRMAQALHDGGPVIFPLFDRARDIAIAGAAEITEETELAVLEGNYLLLDRPIWRDLAPLLSLTVRLDPTEEVLRERLVARWLDHGLGREQAEARTDSNDMPNARLVRDASRGADLTLTFAD